MKGFGAAILSVVLFLGDADVVGAFPGYDSNNEKHQRSLKTEGNSCPMNQIGAELEQANADAIPRLQAWEATYPKDEYGRKYTVGSANPGEVYCDGTGENKFCNKIHGPWGDSIPQKNQTYCLWGMLEFQDPNNIAFGTDMNNTEGFLAIFFDTMSTIFGMDNVSDAVMAVAATTGSPFPDPRYVEEESAAAPWPIASIIWKDGNKYARDWIANVHRPRAQLSGYGIGFTFRGHYKAVQCDTIEKAWGQNNLTREESFNPKTGGLVLNIDSFKEFWNAFVDVEDISAAFEVDTCVVECMVGPCPDTLALDTMTPTDAPTDGPAEPSSATLTTAFPFAFAVIGTISILFTDVV